MSSIVRVETARLRLVGDWRRAAVQTEIAAMPLTNSFSQLFPVVVVIPSLVKITDGVVVCGVRRGDFLG